MHTSNVYFLGLFYTNKFRPVPAKPQRKFTSCRFIFYAAAVPKIHPHGAPKSPRSRAANRSARASHKVDAYTTHLSKRAAYNTCVSQDTKQAGSYSSSHIPDGMTEREWNRELKRIYGKAWQKAKAGHPDYQL